MGRFEFFMIHGSTRFCFDQRMLTKGVRDLRYPFFTRREGSRFIPTEQEIFSRGDTVGNS